MTRRHVVNPLIVQPSASQLDHLRRGIHGGHSVGVPDQPTSPQAVPHASSSTRPPGRKRSKASSTSATSANHRAFASEPRS